MAYEVTATRRRPQRFEDLAGQEFVAATLKNALQSGQIAHAYLFSGPRGCGKTSSARILARSLNCERGTSGSPCGECASCREIAQGSSLDVIEIDGASNTSVNDIRQIKDEILFPPNAAPYKIYIIDEVHMLSISAFNALLKTIEEPPPYVVFIFATTELHKVPATIKSRCQQFHFRLVDSESIKTLLAEAAREIGIQAEDEALYWIARESTGSIRDAYTLFDQAAAFSGGCITYTKIHDTLGLLSIDELNELFTHCAQGNAQKALLCLSAILQNGVSIEQFITDAAGYIRSLLLIQSGITREALLGQAAERYARPVLDAWNQEKLERALSLFLSLYRDIRYSVDPRYEAELSLSRLCGLSAYISHRQIGEAIESARSALIGKKDGGAQTPADSVPGFSEDPAYRDALRREGAGRGSAAEAPPPPSESILSKSLLSGLGHEVSQSQVPQAPRPETGTAPAGEYEGSREAPGSVVSKSPESPAYEAAADESPLSENLHAEMRHSRMGHEVRHEMQHEVPHSRMRQETPQPPPSEGGMMLEELRDAIVKELMESGDTRLAAALADTSGWILHGQTLTLCSTSDLVLHQLKSEQTRLQQLASAMLGQQTAISLTPMRLQDEVQEQPRQVQILCNLFKGTVIGDNT